MRFTSIWTQCTSKGVSQGFSKNGGDTKLMLRHGELTPSPIDAAMADG
jgi:hypothetical protein